MLKIRKVDYPSYKISVDLHHDENQQIYMLDVYHFENEKRGEFVESFVVHKFRCVRDEDVPAEVYFAYQEAVSQQNQIDEENEVE